MKKIPVLLLTTSLLLGPLTTSFAEEITFPESATVSEIQYDSGDKEVKNTNNKDNDKDVIEESQEEVFLGDEKQNLTKDQKESDKKEDNKESEKDSKKDSKKADKKEEELGERDASAIIEEKKDIKLKKVDDIKGEQGVNYITISSEDTNGAPLTGFTYELKNLTTKESITIDFKKDSQIFIEGPDGEYSLELKDKPKEFEDEKPMTFSMPFGEDENKTRLLKLKPKHILKPEVPNTPNPRTADDRQLNIKAIGGVLAVILVLISALIYTTRKNKKIEE